MRSVIYVLIAFLGGMFVTLYAMSSVFSEEETREIIDEVDVSAVVLDEDDSLPPVIRNIQPDSEPVFVREDESRVFSFDVRSIDTSFSGSVDYTINTSE